MRANVKKPRILMVCRGIRGSRHREHATDLRKRGYIVEFVGDVNNPEDLLASDWYEAIIINREVGSLSCRKGDGYAFAREVREIYPALPIIVIDRNLAKTHVYSEDTLMQIVWDEAGWITNALAKIFHQEPSFA
ncbi:MAG: hypothetical protein ACD_81C00149G0001 [uncultured bacterium]|uniref:Uncharacterized protein n=2 Tax=Candidatus Wolfeibacteriota TaxID=1752735 RepID=A0A0G1H8Z6_9BACT|nr:MAG: hypothetical protein ACD_81C00149G0001 [uncultured bacterium]KKR12352.1 MAG: hypothetical protein UT41_C0002G0126 [Candidatus Wolfebacteria bacterium GW2011_GWC2_39_22]KKT43260.1 MAG: hypothetical protein UW32_C0002G0121 [Candidatus Wolfebacteria bacterium GW2011_GWE2_44_13]HBI25979.1 hypothetical protein [Candidatus Wolfebacteria bacterium]